MEMTTAPGIRLPAESAGAGGLSGVRVVVYAGGAGDSGGQIEALALSLSSMRASMMSASSLTRLPQWLHSE